MTNASRARIFAVVGALALAATGLAACGGGDGGGSAAAGECPVDALDGVEGTTKLTFWHVQVEANLPLLLDQIAEFEAAHPNIDVDPVQFPNYEDLYKKYIGGLETGDLPDLVQFEETALQSVVDSDSTLPAQACVEADDYPLDDFVTRTIDYYTSEDVLRALPWPVSNPIFFYNKNVFRAAGLDPEDPPETLDEVREYSEQIVASGAAPHGMALRVEPFIMEFLYAKSGLFYVNNDGGRAERATEVEIDTPEGLEIWSWWDAMVDSGLALNTGSSEQIDHLLAVGNGQVAMTWDASTILGPVFEVLGSGQFANVEVGVGVLPALRAEGGVPVGDGSLWIVDSSSDAEKAAAWELVKFIEEPDQQADFAIGSRGGMIPVRKSALDDPDLQALWTERPYLRIPYDQLNADADSAAANGSVIGDYQGVRNAVRDGLDAMLGQGLDPQAALDQARDQADRAIEAYNSRL